ncbi:hypothetical protein EVG20_g9073, partial [Dentipellis fragilis]
MEEEPEVLDWGQEDDDNFNPNGGDRSHRGSYYDYKRGGGEGDDTEDAVSLGGDEDDIPDFIASPARANQPGSVAAEAAFDRREVMMASRDQSRRRDSEAETNATRRRDQTPHMQSPPPHSSPMAGRTMAPLMHALPPKPVTSDSAFLPLPSTTAASPMSMARRDKERRANGNGSRYAEQSDPLASDRETRSSRGQDNDIFNHSHKSSHEPWSRSTASGGASPVRGRARSRSDIAEPRLSSRRDGDDDTLTRAFERRVPFEPGAHEATRDFSSNKHTSHQDRHYRPDEAGTVGRRQDKVPTGPSRGQGSWVSPERELEQPRISRSNTHRAPSEDTRRPGRSSSLPRDDDSRRFIESDSYRAGPTYRPSDTSTDQVHNGYHREPRRPATNYDRPRRHDYEAPPPRSVTPQDLFVPNQNTGRSSTLRRRSPSPRPSSQYAPSGVDRHYPQMRSDTYRISDAHASRQQTSRSRATSPPHKAWSGSQRDRDRDGYVPAEAIPQRRGRDPDQGIEPDSDAKRRRLDRRSGDSAPSRRAPADLEDHRDRDSSASPLTSSDQSRSRKRIPLPSQTDRYKEMAVVPSQPPPSAPPTAPRSPVNSRVPLPPQPPLSAPSGPRYGPTRNQPPVDYPPRRPQDNAPPPTRTRDRDGRGQSYVDEHRPRDEPMDVDLPHTPRGPAYDDSSRRPATYDRPPRVEVPVRDPPPRAPRAMGSRPPQVSTPSTSPTSPTFPQRPPQPEYPRPRQRDRSPAHLRRGGTGMMARVPRVSLSLLHRDLGRGSSRRRQLNPRGGGLCLRNRWIGTGIWIGKSQVIRQNPRDAPRDISSRGGERLPTGPASRGPSASAPMNGNGPPPPRGGAFPSSREGRPPVDLPPEESMTAGPSMPPRDLPSRARIPAHGPPPPVPPPHRGAPPNAQRRGPPDIEEPPHVPPGYHEKRGPRYPDSRGPAPRQEPRQGQSMQRTSRFGPPPQMDAPPTDEPPRIWIPREEAMNAQLQAENGRRAPSPPPPPPSARPPHGGGGGWHKQPYEPRDKPPFESRDKPPHEPRERPPYEPRDKPPYEPREKAPHKFRDKLPYESREKPPYEPRDKLPYESRGRPPYEPRDKHQPYEQSRKPPFEADDNHRRSADSPPSQPGQSRRSSRFGPPLDDSIIQQRFMRNSEQLPGKGPSPRRRSSSLSERHTQAASPSQNYISPAFRDYRGQSDLAPPVMPERYAGGPRVDPQGWDFLRESYGMLPPPNAPQAGPSYKDNHPDARAGPSTAASAAPPSAGRAESLSLPALGMGPPETPARSSKPVKIRRPAPGMDVAQEPEYQKKMGTPSLLDRMSGLDGGGPGRRDRAGVGYRWRWRGRGRGREWGVAGGEEGEEEDGEGEEDETLSGLKRRFVSNQSKRSNTNAIATWLRAVGAPRAAAVLLHTLYMLHTLAFVRPPNIFTDLGLPLGAPISQLRHRAFSSVDGEVTPSFDELLTRLASFDIRTALVRFGQPAVQACTYCRAQSDFALHALPRTVLAYVRTAAFIALLAPSGTRRRRWGIAALVVAALSETFWALSVPVLIAMPGQPDSPMVRLHSVPSFAHSHIRTIELTCAVAGIVARRALAPPPGLPP